MASFHFPSFSDFSARRLRWHFHARVLVSLTIGAVPSSMNLVPDSNAARNDSAELPLTGYHDQPASPMIGEIVLQRPFSRGVERRQFGSSHSDFPDDGTWISPRRSINTNAAITGAYLTWTKCVVVLRTLGYAEVNRWRELDASTGNRLTSRNPPRVFLDSIQERKFWTTFPLRFLAYEIRLVSNRVGFRAIMRWPCRQPGPIRLRESFPDPRCSGIAAPPAFVESCFHSGVIDGRAIERFGGATALFASESQ